MNKSLFVALVFAVCLGTWGCGGDKIQEQQVLDIKESKDENTLADLLTQSRKDLAAKGLDVETRIRKYEASLRLGTAAFSVLPELRFPLKIPVWQEAKFSESLGFCVPSNLEVGRNPSAVANHLACFGDLEAARKLTGSNTDTPKSLPTDRNYPIEWTRLVALMQFDAEYRLAIGDADAAKELISLHSQLLRVLDDKAKQGCLGADLLGRGRTALAGAALEFKKGSDPALAKAIDSALANWGNAPSPLEFVAWDSAAGQAQYQLGDSDPGQTVILNKTLPFLDLTNLPAISESSPAVVVFCNKSGKTTEILVTYRPKIVEIVSDAAELTPTLKDAYSERGDDASSTRLRRTFQAGNLKCEATLFPQGSVVGGIVRFVKGDGSSSDLSSTRPSISRDFGIIHLDRSFEQNRLQLAPERQGDAIQTKRDDVLKKVKNGLSNGVPSQILVQREKGQEAVSKVILRYERDNEATPLHQLVSSLWQKMGPSHIAEIKGKDSGSLTLTWQDAKTRLTVDIPNSESDPLELVAENRTDTNSAGASAEAGLDQEERKVRIQGGKPLTRLPRQLEGLRLGQTKDQALAALAERTLLQHEFPGGLLLSLPGAASKTADSVLRQVIVRFDGQGKAAAISFRYQRGPAANAVTWVSDQLKDWSKRGGAPSVTSSSSSPLWADVDPKAIALKTYAWHDDLTRVTFDADGATAEATLLDCPLDQPKGVNLGELSFLPLGPEGCELGTTRDQLVKSWQITKPVKTAKVDLILYPPKKSPFDALLVWMENDKVTRVAARHRSPAPSADKLSAAQLISDSWGRTMQTFGWPAHNDFGTDQQLTGMGNYDDVTRVRVYSQVSEDGQPRLFTEWEKIRAGSKLGRPK